MREILRADFARSANVGLAPHLTLLIFRFGQHARGPARWIWRLADRLVLRLLMGTELPLSVRCGRGLALPHGGRGVVMHPHASIGENCMIFHRVTLAGAPDGRAPQLADDVTVGVGAVVIGGVRVGPGATIGANAVVTRDVPAHDRVAGAPARSVRNSGDRGDAVRS